MSLSRGPGRPPGPTYLFPDPIITELIKIREELGVSRVAIAEAVGVAKVSVDKWENETNDPGFRKVVAWAKALGYELDLHPIPEKKKVRHL